LVSSCAQAAAAHATATVTRTCGAYGTCLSAATGSVSLMQRGKVGQKHATMVRELAKPADDARGRLLSGEDGRRDASRYAGLSDTEVTTLDRMIYAVPHDPAPPLDTPRHYFLFDYDLGGMNNIRIGWEMAGLVAQQTNRTLVLPPTKKFYLIPDNGNSKASDYTDLARLKANVPTLTFEEFVEREKDDLTLPDFVLQDSPVASPNDVTSRWQDWATTNNNFEVVNGAACDLGRFTSDSKVLYAVAKTDNKRIFSCGDWAAIGQPRFKMNGQSWETPMESWRLLRNGFVWHPDAYREAARIVNKLGLFEYVALHARYNDFQFDDKRQPVDNVIESLGALLQLSEADESLGKSTQSEDSRSSGEQLQQASASSLQLSSSVSSRGHHAVQSVLPFLTKGTRLYISTDETDPAFFKAFAKHGIEALHWADVEGDIQGISSPERMEAIKGIVEQMVCAYGKVFVATELSTFSSYAQRMRIYADAPVKTRLYHTQKRTPKEDKEIEQELAAWEARGGRDAFEPNDDSLASLAFIPPSL